MPQCYFPASLLCKCSPSLSFAMQQVYIHSVSPSSLLCYQSCSFYNHRTSPPIFVSFPSACAILLVRPGSCLASLQLVKVPPTQGHVSLVFIHAPRKALYVLRTRTSLLLLLSGTSISSLGVVEPIVYRLGIRILRRLLVLILCRFWLRR